MKILVYSDNHWCQYSSILRKMGEKYSLRLENQIKSINWAENLAKKLNCNLVVHCGDFFDKETINSMELTALNDLLFYDKIEHLMLVGNHEMGINNLDYSSMHVFGITACFKIINKPTTIELDDFHQLCFLPYILDYKKQSLKEIFPASPKTRIIFSHNDIAGMQLGGFITKNGYSIEEIEENCDLCINGHIHNSERISSKIFNVGNLTGQNFSEDGFKYHHGVFVIDTDTLKIDVYDNPYAINFYKLDFSENDSINYINEVSTKLKNAVITVKCKEEDYDYLKKRFGSTEDKLVPHHNSIIECRFIVDYSNNNLDSSEEQKIDLSVDHIKEFKQYLLQELGSSETVLSEIEEITK